MEALIRFMIRILPDEIVECLNAESLDELDRRGLIFWAHEVHEFLNKE